MPVTVDTPGVVPLRITAHTPHGFSGDPSWGVLLDGLLGIAVATAAFRTGSPQPVAVSGWSWDPRPVVAKAEDTPGAVRDHHTGLPVVPLDLPLVQPMVHGQRVWAATGSMVHADMKELRTYYGRFSADATAHMTDDRRIISTATGAWKPTISKVVTTVTGRVEWLAVGLPSPIRMLLNTIGHIGKRRGCGEGQVTSWQVEPAEGVTVNECLFTQEGTPLRPIPAPPGYAGQVIPVGRIEPPFWDYRLPTHPILHPNHPFTNYRKEALDGPQ